MAQVDLVMPKMGESIMEATIISWSVQVGDQVEADDTVLEIATDKVDSEVPAPADGTISEILYSENDVVPVGTVIARMEAEGEAGDDAPAPAASEGASAPAQQPVAEPAGGAPSVSSASPSGGVAATSNGRQEALQTAQTGTGTALASALLDQPQEGRFYSPLVMNIARTEGISQEELDRLPGTGKGGRVTKKDILAYVEQKRTAPQQPAAAPQPASAAPAAAQPASAVATGQPPQPTAQEANGQLTFSPQAHAGIPLPPRSFSYSGQYEIEEMDRMRKMIADNMTYSKHISPHVSSFVEADVTNIVQWRQKNKKAFEEKYGEKLTFTPMFVELLARTLRDFPRVNVSLDGYNVIRKKDINVALAVALPSGNLIVPTIKHADRLNLTGLAAAVNDLTSRARDNKLKPDEMADGTYTLSNVGTFGNVMGTPIIMQPQVAVMAVGAIRKKPAVIETESGDFIGVRHMMMLSHSYDHRIVDGMLGGQFVRKFADYLEAWDPNRAI